MKKLFFVSSLFVSLSSFSQDLQFAKKIVDTLTSPIFWGRGYTKNGMVKAADFIAGQMKMYGVKTIAPNSYFQSFSYPVNTFPGRMEVAVNGRNLVPGVEFIVSPDSRSFRGTADLNQRDNNHFVNTDKNVIVSIGDKLTFSVASRSGAHTRIAVDRKAVPENPKIIKADIENVEITNFPASNVCGWVKGTRCPDSIIVISAHYDHLGGMGTATFFPGANDNASGTALLLGLAKYYADHSQPYTIAFICFAGEEAGLIGSKYFTENPMFPLKNIRFLLNLDLEGTGEEGITVVNATEFPKEFETLKAVNDSGMYLSRINPRGKAANSDHYWFTENRVPGFFLYTLGGIKAYHDVFDKAETLPLNEYEDLFKLIIGFNEKLMRSKF